MADSGVDEAFPARGGATDIGLSGEVESGVMQKLFIYLGLFLATLASLYILWYHDKPELMPTTIFSSFAAFFTYHAYIFAKEKFRFDLFERRFEIYSEVVKFCSHVTIEGKLKRTDTNQEAFVSALQSAENSFRGLGLHKSKALFGNDIQKLFSDLSENYSWLISYDTPDTIENWGKLKTEKIKFMWDTIQKLPSAFAPYIYLGNYRK